MPIQSINHSPSFSGLQIKANVPQKIARAIRENPIVLKESQHLNLKFEKVTQDKNNPFIGAIECTIVPIKKFFPTIAKQAKKIVVLFGSDKNSLSNAVNEITARTANPSFFTMALLEKNGLTKKFKANSPSLNYAFRNFYEFVAKEQEAAKL